MVPFRNENENLPNLLHSISALNYPKELVEIILVDDDSVDISNLHRQDFYFEDDIACDFLSYRLQEASQFYMVAMEESTVYYAAKTEATPLFENTLSLHTILFRLDRKSVV